MMWNDLADELDKWDKKEKPAAFWWRDDDAVQPTPALGQLLEIAAGTPVNLAVIPKLAEESLVAYLSEQKNVSVSQHGWAHENHAPSGAKKAEFQGGRRADDQIGDIVTGFNRMASLFGERFTPIFVPPWNRIEESALAGLLEAGIRYLSTFNARTGKEPDPPRLNTHMDIVDWRGTRGFAGHETVLGQASKHLRDKREGRADPAEPTGLLTHHLVHDEACWDFLSEFNRFIREHPGAYWADVTDILSHEGK